MRRERDIMAGLLIMDLLAAAVAASSPVQDCRAISDAARRLACYDMRDTAPISGPSPATPVPSSASPAPPSASAMPPPPISAPSASPTLAPSASSASIVRADPSGTIVSITRLRYGLFRLTLDDGRAFDTATNTAAPPPVGSMVRLRRTAIGTTFLDVAGRSPITVRLVRQ
jgi:hypothetical protein